MAPPGLHRRNLDEKMVAPIGILHHCAARGSGDRITAYHHGFSPRALRQRRRAERF